MKVKVISAEFDSYWYKNKIGEILEVENYNKCNYNIIKDKSHILSKSDCEIIMENTKKPHVHRDVIIAWANGETVQWRENDKGFWVDAYEGATLSWYAINQYRIKPLPEPVYPKTTSCCDNNYAEAVLKNFVRSGQLKAYVAEHGTDGLKGQ